MVPFQYRLGYGSVFRKNFNFLMKSRYWSKERLIEYQNEKLRKLIIHAYKNVPYYTRLFDKLSLKSEDIRTAQDLKKLPILTKQIVRDNIDELLAQNMLSMKRKKVSTSGTTGEPFSFYQDFYADARQLAFTVRHRYCMSGYSLRKPIVRLRSYVPEENEPPVKFRCDSNTFYFSAYHMTKKNMSKYVDTIKKHNLQYIVAYPSSAYLFAEFLRQEKIKLDIRGVVTSSETLTDAYKSSIESYLGKVFDFYTQNEHVACIRSCQNDIYHVDMEYSIVEFVKDKSLPSTHRKIIGTNIHNYVMPLIRYDTGDISHGLTGLWCSCGQAGDKIWGIEGRQDDFLYTSSGIAVPPINFYTMFNEFDTSISAFQMLQAEDGSLVIKIVKKKSLSDETEELLLKKLHKRLGKTIKIKIVYVDTINRNKKTGKIRSIVSKRKMGK